MGQKSSVPTGGDFPHGVSFDEIGSLARVDPGPSNAKRHTAAPHRKRGKAHEEIARIIDGQYEKACAGQQGRKGWGSPAFREALQRGQCEG